MYGNSKDTNGPIATRTKNSNSSKLIFPIPVFKFFARTFYRSIKFFYRTALLIELIGRAYDAGRSTSYNTAFRNILCYDGSTSNNGVRAYYNTWHDKTPPPDTNIIHNFYGIEMSFQRNKVFVIAISRINVKKVRENIMINEGYTTGNRYSIMY